MKKKTKNKKNYVIDIVILIAVVLSFIAVFIIDHNNRKEVSVFTDVEFNPDFVSLGNYNDLGIEDNYVFTSYQEYDEKVQVELHVSSFNKNVVTEKDFQKNNYVLIRVEFDSCADRNIIPTDYKIKGNNIDVTFRYERSCGVCAPQNTYFLLKVSKDLTEAQVNLNYIALNNIHCDPNVSYKPLIYLYPTEKMNVTVKLGKPESLTTTYPKYNNSWKVLALPDGSLYDSNNRYYYGLYWEGLNNIE